MVYELRHPAACFNSAGTPYRVLVWEAGNNRAVHLVSRPCGTAYGDTWNAWRLFEKERIVRATPDAATLS